MSADGAEVRKANIRRALGTDFRIVAWLVKLGETVGWTCSKTCTYAVPDGEQRESGLCPWCDAELVRIEPPRAVSMRELAAFAQVSEGKVAIAMKNAIAGGYATKDKALSAEGQTHWQPTSRAIAELPADGSPHVMPEVGEVEVAGGTFKAATNPQPSKTLLPGDEPGEWLPATEDGRQLEEGEFTRVRPELTEGDQGDGDAD